MRNKPIFDTSLFTCDQKASIIAQLEAEAIKQASRYSDTIVPAGKPIDAKVFDNRRWGQTTGEAIEQVKDRISFDVKAEIENGLNRTLARIASKEQYRQLRDGDFSPASPKPYWDASIPPGFGSTQGGKAHVVPPTPKDPERHLYDMTIKMLAAMLDFHDALSFKLRERGEPTVDTLSQSYGGTI